MIITRLISLLACALAKDLQEFLEVWYRGDDVLLTPPLELDMDLVEANFPSSLPSCFVWDAAAWGDAFEDGECVPACYWIGFLDDGWNYYVPEHVTTSKYNFSDVCTTNFLSAANATSVQAEFGWEADGYWLLEDGGFCQCGVNIEDPTTKYAEIDALKGLGANLGADMENCDIFAFQTAHVGGFFQGGNGKPSLTSGTIGSSLRYAGGLSVSQKRYGLNECSDSVNTVAGGASGDNPYFGECLGGVDNGDNFTHVYDDPERTDDMIAYAESRGALATWNYFRELSFIDDWGMVIDTGIFNGGAHYYKCTLEDLKIYRYIDRQTKSVELVQPVMSSAGNGLFGGVRITFNIDLIGNVQSEVDIFSAEIRPMYTTRPDKARLALEIVFMACVFAYFVQELKEMKAGFRVYVCDPWNVADLISLFLFMSQGLTWITICNTKEKFQLATTLDVISDWGTEVSEVYSQIANTQRDAEDIMNAEEFYQYLNFLSLLIATIRLFKFFTCHPALSIVTDTMKHAAGELLHFSIVFGLLLCLFSMMGLLMFGSTNNEFYQVPWHWLMRAAVGDWDFAELRGVLGGTATFSPLALFYFWAWVLLVTILLMNVLLSIVIDAFNDGKVVKEKAGAMALPAVPVILCSIVELGVLLPLLNRLVPARRARGYMSADEALTRLAEDAAKAPLTVEVFTAELHARTGLRLDGHVLDDIRTTVLAQLVKPPADDGDGDGDGDGHCCDGAVVVMAKKVATLESKVDALTEIMSRIERSQEAIGDMFAAGEVGANRIISRR